MGKNEAEAKSLYMTIESVEVEVETPNNFLSDPQKFNWNILNMAWWSIGTNNVFVDTQNLFWTKKKGGV